MLERDSPVVESEKRRGADGRRGLRGRTQGLLRPIKRTLGVSFSSSGFNYFISQQIFALQLDQFDHLHCV
jgi:hypothetical protein